MRPRVFSAYERDLLRKMWAKRETFPVLAICSILQCSTKTIVREVEAMGLPPRRRHDQIRNRKYPRARCRCGTRLASRHGQQCRACYEHREFRMRQAATPRTWACPHCHGPSPQQAGHSICILRHQGRAA